MKQVPTDGSYYTDSKGCSKGPSGCSAHTIVRRLNLDRDPEGASVTLCNFHWNREMTHRAWMNKEGVAEPWDVFDFYEPDPALELVAKEKPDEEEPETVFYKMNLSSPGAKTLDLFTASSNMYAGSTVPYKLNIPLDLVPDWIKEVKQTAHMLKRTKMLICLFDHVRYDSGLTDDRIKVVREIFNVLENNATEAFLWREAIKNA